MKITKITDQHTITMTTEQTEAYDAGSEAAERLMRELRAEARELHEQTGETVEIHTADGIVAAVVQAVQS